MPANVGSHYRIRQDLLRRLLWNVITPVEDVAIRTGALDQTIDSPLFDHPATNEPLSDPPLARIDKILIEDFGNKQLRQLDYDEDERWQPPNALKIENPGPHSPITVRQFVLGSS